MKQKELKDECFEDRSINNNLPNMECTKEERYSWRDVSNDYGEFKLINKEDLKIDVRYQRESISNRKILSIVKDFDWKLFGTISVIQRKNGGFYIYDGGHRWRGTMYRNTITYLPCMVFKLDNLSEEAMVFHNKNTQKSAVSPYHRFKSLVVAEDDLAIKAKDILNKYGYSAAKTQTNPLDFRPISTFLSMVKTNEEYAMKAFDLCAAIADKKEAIQGSALRGVFYLIRYLKEDICAGKNRTKLISIGMRAIEAGIKREKLVLGIGGERVEAKAILDTINNRRPKKIPFPSK